MPFCRTRVAVAAALVAAGLVLSHSPAAFADELAEVTVDRTGDLIRVRDRMVFNEETGKWTFDKGGKGRTFVPADVTVSTAVGELLVDEDGVLWIVPDDETRSPLRIMYEDGEWRIDSPEEEGSGGSSGEAE